MRVAATLAALVCGLAIAACGGPEWVEVRSEEGGFAVQMPGQPQQKTRTVQTPMGDVPLFIKIVERRDAAFFVGFTDYPAEILRAGTEKVLDGARDGAADNIQGTVVADHPYELGTNKGREIAILDSTGGVILQLRLILVGRRLYMVEAAVPRRQRDSAEVRKYLESFELLDQGDS